MIKLKDLLEIDKKEKFDRVQYYVEYISNLVPSTFKVESINNEIKIKIK